MSMNDDFLLPQIPVGELKEALIQVRQDIAMLRNDGSEGEQTAVFLTAAVDNLENELKDVSDIDDVDLHKRMRIMALINFFREIMEFTFGDGDEDDDYEDDEGEDDVDPTTLKIVPYVDKEPPKK